MNHTPTYQYTERNTSPGILQHLSHPKTIYDNIAVWVAAIAIVFISLTGVVATMKQMKRRRLDEICIEQPDF